jgi:hypothetical protein
MAFVFNSPSRSAARSPFRAPAFPRTGGGGGSSIGGSVGPAGPPGRDGAFPLDLPETPDVDSIPVVRVSGGEVNFDYLRADDIEFGNRGVPVGRYMAAADNNIKAAMAAAFAANSAQSVLRLDLPYGEHAMTQLGTADGLRSNLILNGGDAERCILYRASAGQMLLWAAAAENVVIENVTFDFRDISDPFSASLNIATEFGFTNLLLRRCRFLCSIPDTVDNDGIRHQVNVYGTNICVRDCYFLSSQLRFNTIGGVSSDRCDAFDNRFEDCNDLGISCVGGDGAGTISNINIKRNRFYGVLKGSGYIYVGSDGNSTNPSSVTDVDICDNTCEGAIGQLGTDPDSRPASRTGIYVVFGNTTKRIRINGNRVVTTNPSFDTDNVSAISMYARKAGVTSVTDLEISGNTADFRCLNDTKGAFNILDLAGDMTGVSGVKIDNNIASAPTGGGTSHRGIVVHNASDVEITKNRIIGSSSNALLLKALVGHQSDLVIRHNVLDTAVAFFHSISFQGNKNWSRVIVENNPRLTQANGKSVKNEGSGTVDLAVYNDNGHTTGGGVDGGLTPTQNRDNRAI